MSAKNSASIKSDWNSRGYNFGVFKDPPGRVWAEFVNRMGQSLVQGNREG